MHGPPIPKGLGGVLVLSCVEFHSSTGQKARRGAHPEELKTQKKRDLKMSGYFYHYLSDLGLVLFTQKSKTFQDSLSHRILWYMHEAVNIDKNKK